MSARFVGSRVPLVDLKTGLCAPIWYRFFEGMFETDGGGGTVPDTDGFLVSPGNGSADDALSRTGALSDELNQGGFLPPDAPGITPDSISQFLDLNPPASESGVFSISFGTTGLTPATATKGAVTVGGVLNVANGGTGLSTLTANTIYKGNGASALAVSQITDDGTKVGVGTAFSPASPKFTVGGNRSYFAANSESYAVGVQYNTTTGACYVGATNSATPDMLFSDSAGSIRFRLGHNGGAQVTSSLSVGNVTPTASGAGITFPATQSPSTDANTLDDYEEGTWNPTVTSNGGSISAVSASGHYTKIGRQVHATVVITITNNGTGSGFINCPLPFTAATGPRWSGYGWEASITGNMCRGTIDSGATSIFIVDYVGAYPGGGGTATARTVIMTFSYHV